MSYIYSDLDFAYLVNSLTRIVAVLVVTKIGFHIFLCRYLTSQKDANTQPVNADATFL